MIGMFLPCFSLAIDLLWHRFGWSDVEQHFHRGADGLNMNDYPDQISFTSHCPHTHTSVRAGCLAANGELHYA